MTLPRLFTAPSAHNDRHWDKGWAYGGPVLVSLFTSNQEYFFDGNGHHEDFTIVAPVFKLIVENADGSLPTPPTNVVIRLDRDDGANEELDIAVPELEAGAGLVRNFGNRYAPRITDIKLVGWLSDIIEDISDWYELPENVELLKDDQTRPR